MGKKLSEEHKAKLAAGRERALAEKRRREAEQQAEASEITQVAADIEQNVNEGVDQSTSVDQAHPKVITGKPSEATPDPEPVQPTDKPEVSYSDLIKQIEELKNNQAFMQQMVMQNQPQQGQQPAFGGSGLIGTRTKYIVDPAYYTDPVQRLAKEPRLQQFAFDMNYTLDWSVTTAAYETKTGVNTEEPKFNIQLNRIIRDPDTGADTNGRYIVCKGVFFEDPQSAIVVAREQGIDVNEYNEKDFLEEMRYIRVRDWLMEAFYPPKLTDGEANKKQMVINGKMVDYFEVNSENSSNIPFDKLNTKV